MSSEVGKNNGDILLFEKARFGALSITGLGQAHVANLSSCGDPEL